MEDLLMEHVWKGSGQRVSDAACSLTDRKEDLYIIILDPIQLQQFVKSDWMHKYLALVLSFPFN